jgi:pimeloyl-ACP methyl ester carboxylesterase
MSIPADETFDGTWPYAPHFFDGAGFRMHYVDEGPRDGETLVCLHGEPTWGYLYRAFIPRLVRYGRVVVPDHMGFGKSETPQDRDYSIRDHAGNLEKLLLHLDLRDVTLVVQDWGGPIGAAFAYRNPDRVKRLCVMNTGVGGQPPEGVPTVLDYPWFQWVQSDAFEPTVSNLSATILSVMKRIGFERTAHVDETWIRAYAAPFETKEECRGALQFPRNIAHPETAKFMLECVAAPGAVDAIRAKPAMYVHGEADRAIPTEMGVAGFRSLFPEAPVVTLPGVGHFLQEDAPEAVTALIAQFIQMTR